MRDTTLCKPVLPCELPPEALLKRYADQGDFTDCYRIEVPGEIRFEAYVATFYTTALFKLERRILATAVARPSSDAQAAALGRGEIEQFAAWRVESRAEGQLLLSDYRGRTRSWLMARPAAQSNPGATALYFGSAVVKAGHDRHGQARMGFAFRALAGFHHLYSLALLRAAASKLRRDAD